MKQLIFNYSFEFFTHLKEVYDEDRSVSVDIASFGMYLGITKDIDWHKKKYPVDSRYFVEGINRDKLRMIIGIPEIIHCVKPICNHCVENYNKRLAGFAATQQKLHLPITFIKDSHLKMYRIGDRYFSGGINLTNSKYMDASFEITDREYQIQIQATFDKLWQYQNRDPSIFQAIQYREEEDG